MAWEISLHEEVERWFPDLCRHDPQTADGVADALDQLAEMGPTLGRPLVDRIHASRHHNMKELRPPSTGTSEVRMLFAFDPDREAVFLVAGDKTGAGKPGIAKRSSWPTRGSTNTCTHSARSAERSSSERDLQFLGRRQGQGGRHRFPQRR